MKTQFRPSRLRGALAVAAALTMSPGGAGAQTQPMPMPMPMPMPQAQPLPGQPVEGGRSRGVFLATFAQAVVPGLVSGIDAWLRSKLNVPMQGGPGDPMQAGNMAGNYRPPEMPGMPSPYGPPGGMPPAPMPMPQGQMIPNSFSPQMNQPMGQPLPAQPAMSAPPAMGEDMPALQAGVAYQVSLVGRDGSRTLVDPAQRSFGTGERILLAFRTNLPGLVEVFNIDATGREELIDQQQMSAGQLANLGPYEFVNVKGEETLRIVLRPCVGGDGNPATRGMVRVQVNPELGSKMLGCDDPAMRQQPTGTRGIAKVQLEGGTNFALDPLSRSEIDSGRLEPREVRVRFLHR